MYVYDIVGIFSKKNPESTESSQHSSFIFHRRRSFLCCCVFCLDPRQSILRADDFKNGHMSAAQRDIVV